MSSHGEPGDDAHIEAMVAGFRAAGEFFTGLANPKQARRVLKALQAEDPTEMRKLMAKVPPFAGKCLSLCGAIRVIIEGEELQEVKLCMLKPNLTGAQLYMAKRIYEKHFGPLPRLVVGPGGGKGEFSGTLVADVIWPSAYQDELVAAGLVDCWQDKVSVPHAQARPADVGVRGPLHLTAPSPTQAGGSSRWRTAKAEASASPTMTSRPAMVSSP